MRGPARPRLSRPRRAAPRLQTVTGPAPPLTRCPMRRTQRLRPTTSRHDVLMECSFASSFIDHRCLVPALHQLRAPVCGVIEHRVNHLGALRSARISERRSIRRSSARPNLVGVRHADVPPDVGRARRQPRACRRAPAPPSVSPAPVAALPTTSINAVAGQLRQVADERHQPIVVRRRSSSSAARRGP